MGNHRPPSDSDPQGLPPGAVAGEATFSGCLVVVDVARHALQSMLPSSMTLPSVDAAVCPCLLVFGEQREGTTFFGGFSVPWGLCYHELMAAVPFVHRDGAAGPHLFVTGMVCDFWPAVLNGNVYYGFSKRAAPMTWDGERFVVGNADDGPDFCGTARPMGGTADASFEWVRTAAALPVLGRRSDGAIVASRFDWDFSHAAVERAALHLTLGPGFQELPLARDATFLERTYRVRGMRWRLSWPVPGR